MGFALFFASAVVVIVAGLVGFVMGYKAACDDFRGEP